MENYGDNKYGDNNYSGPMIHAGYVTPDDSPTCNKEPYNVKEAHLSGKKRKRGDEQHAGGFVFVKPDSPPV